ncbi:hypothetical protein ACOMHN_041561 [Nucella lapillus]
MTVLPCRVSITLPCQYYPAVSVLPCSDSITLPCQYYPAVSVSITMQCQYYPAVSVLPVSVSITLQCQYYPRCFVVVLMTSMVFQQVLCCRVDDVHGVPAAWCMWLRYKQVRLYYSHVETQDAAQSPSRGRSVRRKQRANTACLVIGVVTALGVSIVGNFQVSALIVGNFQVSQWVR